MLKMSGLSVFSINIFLFFTLFFFIVIKWYKRKTYKLPPPYPGAWPVIGHSLQLLTGTGTWEFCRNIMDYTLRSGNNIVYFKWGPYTTYVTINPDECYTLANLCQEKHDLYNFAKPLLGEGLFTGKVSTWKSHRKLLNPAMNQQFVDGLLPQFNEMSKILVDMVKKNAGQGSFDIFPAIKSNTLRTAFTNILGLDFDNNAKAHLYAELFDEFVKLVMYRINKIWPISDLLFGWSGLKKQQDEIIHTMHMYNDQIITEKEVEMQNKTDENGLNKNKSFLEFLIKLKLENHFTNQDVKHEANTMIVTAFDTSAVALMQVLLVLGSFSVVQDKVYKELQEIFGGSDRNVTKEDLLQMKYLEAVIKETLRLYPIAPIVFRRIDKDVNIGEYTLPAGHDLMIPLYALNRHPMWGPDAESFSPERWLDPSRLPKTLYANAAFSIGRRNCYGIKYAMMSLKISTAYLMRRYRVLSDISKVKYEIYFTLNPVSGHHITLEERDF